MWYRSLPVPGQTLLLHYLLHLVRQTKCSTVVCLPVPGHTLLFHYLLQFVRQNVVPSKHTNKYRHSAYQRPLYNKYRHLPSPSCCDNTSVHYSLIHSLDSATVPVDLGHVPSNNTVPQCHWSPAFSQLL